METLLTTQKTEISELNRLISNYKSDGSTKNNETYLNDKITTFSNLFRIIEERDGAIQEIMEPAYGNQPYFTENTFNTFKILYDGTMMDIKMRLETFEQRFGSFVQQSTREQWTFNDTLQRYFGFDCVITGFVE